MKPLLERDIEDYLVKRVESFAGEVRKVKWIGRRGAPDRVVMLPGRKVIWVELKRPGKLAKFPSTTTERAQQREHRRMSLIGQTVVVIDSLAGVDGLLE
jgi:hypothetical protein